MSLRSLGSALTSSDLTPYPERVCDIDHITAIGYARDIGSALVKLRLGIEVEARPIMVAASKVVGRKIPSLSRGERHRIARWALREWVDGICQSCGGSGVRVGDNNVSKACGVCDASGVRRYSDAERERGTNLRQTRAVQRALSILSDYLQGQFRGAVGDVRRAMR